MTRSVFLPFGLAVAYAQRGLGAAVRAVPLRAIDPNHPLAVYFDSQLGVSNCADQPNTAESKCQALWVSSVEDFCLFAPGRLGDPSDDPNNAFAYCTTTNHHARPIPDDTITAAHYTWHPNYVQITGKGNMSNINVAEGTQGGYDPYRAGQGAPAGGVTFLMHAKVGMPTHFVEWYQHITDTEFCLRACYDGLDSTKYCNHELSQLPCPVIVPGDYSDDKFDQCRAPNGPGVGVWEQDGETKTISSDQADLLESIQAQSTSSCKRVTKIGGDGSNTALFAVSDPVAKPGAPTQSMSKSSSRSTSSASAQPTDEPEEEPAGPSIPAAAVAKPTTSAAVPSDPLQPVQAAASSAASSVIQQASSAAQAAASRATEPVINAATSRAASAANETSEAVEEALSSASRSGSASAGASYRAVDPVGHVAFVALTAFAVVALTVLVGRLA